MIRDARKRDNETYFFQVERGYYVRNSYRKNQHSYTWRGRGCLRELTQGKDRGVPSQSGDGAGRGLGVQQVGTLREELGKA